MDKEETAKAVADENPQAPTEELSEPTPAEVDGEAARKKKRKVVIAAVAAFAALSLVGAGAVYAMGGTSDRPAGKQASAAVEKKGEEVKSEVKLTLKAEGADDAAAPAKVKVTREGKDVVGEREVACNKAVDLGELEKGDYELVVTSAPVLEDGSTYKLPEAPAKVSVDGKGKAVEVECALSRVAKEEMSKEQLEAAAGVLEAAGKADSAASVAQAAQSAPSVPGSESAVRQDVATPATPSGGSSGSNTGNVGGNSDATTHPAHEHSWTPVTVEQWVPNNVWVQDSAAWDEPKYSYETHIICNQCGTDFGSVDAWGSHLVRGGACVSYRSEARQVQTGTIHHEATGHYEDRGHNETVTTGYSCSCGATK